MSAIGLDPGSSRGAFSECVVDGTNESLKAQPELKGGVLPSAVLRDEVLEPMLEYTTPLSPFGVGGCWPPESQVGLAVGARRLPLALAMAALEREPDAGVLKASESKKWTWTSVANLYDQQAKKELISALVRRAVGGVAQRMASPTAVAVANELPLLEQTAIVGKAGGAVRLVWRCMAAGLAWAHGEFGQKGAAKKRAVADGTTVLHVHLGLDGFEATRFEFRHARGREGPRLLVPVRSRPSPRNTRTRPFLGLQLCAHAHWNRLRDDDRLWTALFGAANPMECPEQGVQRIRTSPPAQPDCRVGWTQVLEGSCWSAERASREIDTWLADVQALLSSTGHERPDIVLLTGDYARQPESQSTAKVLVTPLAAVRALCERYKIDLEVLHGSGISAGAALFASRRSRGWATFLDELPSVEIVVQTPAGAAWKTLLEAKHYDAGSPVVVKLDQFWLNAGEKHVELPVYVDEFGPDTPNVLKTRVDFNRATKQRTTAEVVVEVEAATGLPIVKAAIHGEVDETAEVDWANDHERAHTGLRKSEYLQQLPRTFPPLQERMDGLWWIQGGKYKTVTLNGLEYTGETLGGRLETLFPGVEQNFVPALQGFARLAAKKEWHPGSKKLIAATDLDGRNGSSKTLERAAETLFKSVQKQWKKPTLSNTAGRALASLCWQDPKWIEHLMVRCSDVEDLKELSYVIAALGACTQQEDQMARAIHAFARRLHDKVNIAKATYKQPVGIHTLRAMGTLFAHRPDALKRVRDDVATQLAEDITEFIELTLELGKFMQKFQAALRALVYLTRRRAYQDGFLPVDSVAFRRSVSCCAKVYIATRLAAEGSGGLVAQDRLVAAYKADLKALRLPGHAPGMGAHEATCRVIDEVDMSRVRMDGTKFPTNPDKLLEQLVQVVQYIEGRGTGILVMGDDDDEDEEE